MLKSLREFWEKNCLPQREDLGAIQIDQSFKRRCKQLAEKGIERDLREVKSKMVGAKNREPLHEDIVMRRSGKSSAKPLRELNQTPNVLQLHKSRANIPNETPTDDTIESRVEGIEGIKSILDDEPANQPKPGPSTSSASAVNFSSDAAALYDELDSFRQRWKRELEVTKTSDQLLDTNNEQSQSIQPIERHSESKENDNIQSSSSTSSNATLRQSYNVTTDRSNDPKQIYALAKKLFLIGVDLEQDEMHHESIRYYKQAVHLCPDIEKQIFREQCEASTRVSSKQPSEHTRFNQTGRSQSEQAEEHEKVEITPLLERVRQSYCDDVKNRFGHCRPSSKPKAGTKHISQLPHELVMQIFRYVVGEELDLASLESLGMVCRGFFLLSRDQSLWRNVCFETWGNGIPNLASNCADESNTTNEKIDWRQIYLDNPRVNFDGVYISRTRYIRQGDVGFQDLTYRPFHIIRYYRYLRFFPDKRVLILTTNEEPERIVPIFRHALKAKQFSSELSILEGTYELANTNQVIIVADKDCRALIPAQIQNQTNRRQAQFMWSRQTPLAQKFTLKFELKTVDSKAYRNNVLKWLDYTILTRLETGQELTTFDMNPDTFPSLVFSRVRRFNLKSAKPLASH